MLRARLRLAAAVVLAAACVAAAGANVANDANQPTLAPMPDCAHRFDGWLSQLRHALPSRGVIAFVGPREDSGCDPLMVAQYALAPVYVVELEHLQHRIDLAARHVHLVPREPPVILLWGDEGAEWLATRDDFVPLTRRVGSAQLMARTR